MKTARKPHYNHWEHKCLEEILRLKSLKISIHLEFFFQIPIRKKSKNKKHNGGIVEFVDLI